MSRKSLWLIVLLTSLSLGTAAFAAGSSAPAVTSLPLPAAAGGTTCEYIAGPSTHTSFTMDPETGLIHLTVPMTIGSHSYTVDFEVAILGFLKVSDQGFPETALVTHTWHIRENGLELNWTGQANLTPTNDPTMANYTIRLDMVAANGRFSGGTLFADGVFNLTNGSGTAGDFYGKVCFATPSGS